MTDGGPGVAPREVAGADGGETAQRWLFGRAVFDEVCLELTVDGKLVEIEHKPLEVLAYLLRHAGEVVTKDEFAEHVWPGRILTESVLSRAVSALRAALGDEHRDLIKTVHGFGYRLVAQIKVEAAKPFHPPAFNFAAGTSPPLRPHWKLVERLGTGGHGEAWLARHDKTGEQRVFKFALDQNALVSLKREITLYRLLRETLGASAPIVSILEWNLAEQPYFVETEYVEGRDLSAWASAQGGLAVVSLPLRLELAAQIAEAVAAAHSVGVLHKDLKPGNILVDQRGPKPQIRLCDFGSGGVLDLERLKRMGITSLGFTRTGTETSGTPLYLAPEVIAGQPFTVKADIYALGLLLYQLVVGDFSRPLAAGWEMDVEDELLRKDIAESAAGAVDRRLAEASLLAERLRTLDARRQARAAEIAEKQRAERARKALAELRRVRVYAGVLLVLATAAIGAGVIAHRARSEAVAAAAAAKAVSDFLMEDVFRVESNFMRSSGTTYESLISHAATQVDNRLKGQPEAAASVHSLLGRRFQEIGQFETARSEYERSATLLAGLYGEGAPQTLMALDRLTWMYLETGQISKALALSDQVRDRWAARSGPRSLAFLEARARRARVLSASGHLLEDERELRDILRVLPTVDPPTEEAAIFLHEWLGIPLSDDMPAPAILDAYARMILGGNVLEEVGEDDGEAEVLVRNAVETFAKVLGEHSEMTAVARISLVNILALEGKYEEAERIGQQAQEFLKVWLPPKHYARGVLNVCLARLRLEQHRLEEAGALGAEALQFCTPEGGCPPRVRAEILWDLGNVYNELGQRAAAIDALRESLSLQQKIFWPGNATTLRTRVHLAHALLLSGNTSEAKVVLSAVDREAVASLRPRQRLLADLRRVEGTLALQEQSFGHANSALQQALEIVEHRYGVTHWRTQRAREELAQAKAAAERAAKRKKTET